MAFNINDFRANINRYGIVKASNYEVEIRKRVPDVGIENNIRMRCSAASLPGREAMTFSEKIYGPATVYGYDSQPGSTSFTIISSENFSEKEYFDKWIDDIIGKYRTQDTGIDRFEIGYYDDYIGTVTIKVGKDTGELTYETELVEAFPTSIGSMGLSWSEGNQIMTFDVTVAYRYYKNRLHP